MKFSKDYLLQFYYEILNEYDAVLADITEKMVPLVSVEYVATTLLNAEGPHINIGEDRTRPHNTVWGLFGLPMKESILPTANNFANLPQEVFLGACDKLTFHMMRLIYISAGGPGRTPELQLLRFGNGKEKNIFINLLTRRLEIVSDYWKNGSNKKIIKVLDKRT